MKSTATLYRYALAQAAAELGQHAVTLRKALKARGIEPSGPGGFTLAELVASQLPNGDSVKEKSLAAHAAFLTQKATLTQLEVREKEGALIARAGAFQFLSELIRTLCNEIRGSSLPDLEQERILGELCAVAQGLWVMNGWKLEPQLSFKPNGARETRDRREVWQSAVCSWLAQASEAKRKAREKEADQPDERIDLGHGRPSRRRAKPGRHRRVQPDVEGRVDGPA